MFNSKDKPTKWTFNNNNKMIGCVFNSQVQPNNLHPTQKDPNVIMQLTELLSNKGDVIFDPFMGSGTQGVVCKWLDRKFIGIEKDKTYFERAKNRIENGIEKITKTNEKSNEMSMLDLLGGELNV